MAVWKEFAEESPRITEVVVRWHTATGHLCLLATLRSDGYPWISPMEPRIFDGRLVLVGMPNTLKFRDLGRDPRFSLHTATVDPYVGDGDIKLWGNATDVQDRDLHRRFATIYSSKPGSTSRARAPLPFTSPTSEALHRSSLLMAS